MERNRAIYFWNTLLFLVSLFLVSSFVLFSYFFNILGGDDLGGLMASIGFVSFSINLLIFLFIFFRCNISNKINKIYIVLNWLSFFVFTLTFLLSLIGSGSSSLDHGLSVGIISVFVLLPLFIIFTLIPWIGSAVFYFKNRIVLSSVEKTKAKSIPKLKWTLIIGVILSILEVSLFFIIESFFPGIPGFIRGIIFFPMFIIFPLLIIPVFFPMFSERYEIFLSILLIIGSFISVFIVILTLNQIKSIIYITKNKINN